MSSGGCVASAIGASVFVAICAAMLWRQIGVSIGCCELAFLAHAGALQAAARVSEPERSDP